MGNPLVYKLVGEERELPGKMLRKVTISEPIPGYQEKVLMVLGATGAGKSTLINGMVNYILGVQWKDNFRFKLITDEAKSQAHSQTSTITAYTIHHMEGSRVPYNITIIDTPGFGDTSGLKRDEEITKQLKEFFSIGGQNGISHLDGIGFVTQSALARLTPTQQYIFDSILSIFGKDVAKNIFMMVTFADGQKPPVMTAIETAKIPHSGFFKFNNSALFAEASEEDEDEDHFDEMFWRMGVTSFKRFFAAFQKAESVSLTMTKDVLKQRDRLQAIIGGLQRRIQDCLSDMELLRQERMLMQKHEAAITANKKFEDFVDIPWYDTEKLSPGTFVTTCLHCNINCHFPCAFSDNDDKKYCGAMSGAYCTVCEDHCHWSVHKNTGERFVKKFRREKRTLEDLKKKYESASSEKSALENMIDSHQHKLEEAHAELHESVDEARRCLMKLEEIALKPNPLTQVDYIQLLINSEEKQAQEGWSDRVNYLQTTMEQAKLLSVLKDVDNIDQRITDLKEKEDTGWEEMVQKLEQVKRIKVEVDTIKKERQAKGFVGAMKDLGSAVGSAIVGGVKSLISS